MKRYRLRPPGTRIPDGVPRWYGGAESCAAIVTAWNACGQDEYTGAPATGEIPGAWDCWIIVEDRRRLTSAQILSVAGTLSAIIGTVGGFLGSPQIIGVAGAIMLAGNIFAFHRDRGK